MDLTGELMATYIATLRGILEIIKSNPKISIKKLIAIIEAEIKGMREQVTGAKCHGQN